MMNVGASILEKLEQHKAKLEVVVVEVFLMMTLIPPRQARIMKQSACIEEMRLEEASAPLIHSPLVSLLLPV
jgi:hypothetical protein